LNTEGVELNNKAVGRFLLTAFYLYKNIFGTIPYSVF